MSLRRLRPRHVYATSLAVFVALLGFEGARMAAGKDPALARPAASVPRDTSAAPDAGDDPGFGGGYDPGGSAGVPDPNFGGGSPQQQDIPQPESRLS